MIDLQSPRCRVILAAAALSATLTLVGLGLAAHKAYRACFWARAEARYVRSESVMLVRGGSTDHSYSFRHYSFNRKGGEEVQLYFLERASTAPLEKTIAVLYSPSAGPQITQDDASLWDRPSNVYLWLLVGLVMAAAGSQGCLAGAVLLVRERRRLPPPLPPLAIPV